MKATYEELIKRGENPLRASAMAGKDVSPWDDEFVPLESICGQDIKIRDYEVYESACYDKVKNEFLKDDFGELVTTKKLRLLFLSPDKVARQTNIQTRHIVRLFDAIVDKGALIDADLTISIVKAKTQKGFDTYKINM